MTASSGHPAETVFADYISDTEGVRHPLEHSHDWCELALFIEASVELFVKDTKYDVRGGDLAFFDGREVHRLFYALGRPYSRFAVHFSKSFVDGVLGAAGLRETLDWIIASPRRTIRLTPKQRSEMAALFHRTVVLCGQDRSKPSAGALAELKLIVPMLLLRFRQFASAAAADAVPVPDASRVVKRLIAYIDERYMEPVRLEELEAVAGRSRFQLCRLFKRNTRMTVMEYVQHRRILEAQKMLVGTKKQIVTICFDCGFNNTQHFHRVFMKLCGMTPLQYRKLGAQETGAAPRRDPKAGGGPGRRS